MVSKVNKLLDLARERGLDIVRFEFVHPSLSNVRVVYHSYKKAGEIPMLQHCRDKQDYDLLMEQWVRRGEICSLEYHNFDLMISGELKRLKRGG